MARAILARPVTIFECLNGPVTVFECQNGSSHSGTTSCIECQNGSSHSGMAMSGKSLCVAVHLNGDIYVQKLNLRTEAKS